MKQLDYPGLLVHPATYYTKSRTLKPRFVVIHYTAGRSFERSLHTLTNSTSKVSAHFLIARDGRVAQMVSLDKPAWHAGKSEWNGIVGLNNHSIGIELDNAGKLRQVDEYTWETYYEEKLRDESEVYTHADGTHWHAYTHKQLESLWDVMSRLTIQIPTLEEIVGHSDIAPKRKVDPGPAFPMNDLKAAFPFNK